ncbi:MAG: Ig-like domain-containing protein, partial [ANME-2 cluster archaeon]|nr:Ig-like domain-containing protein [ANME-2 cluster archaeon]
MHVNLRYVNKILIICLVLLIGIPTALGLPLITGNDPTGTDVPVTTVITVTFNESMNTTSVESAFSTSPPVTGTFNWSGDTMTFTPDTYLAYSTLYEVIITTGAEDLAGIPLATAYLWNFTTAAKPLEPPEPPTSYWGNASGNNVLLSGASITVHDASDTVIANATSLDSPNQGLYQVNVTWDNLITSADEGVIADETITFKVNGITATSRVIDPKGSNINIDLNVSYGPPEPPEPPTSYWGNASGNNVLLSGASITVHDDSDIVIANTMSLDSPNLGLYRIYVPWDNLTTFADEGVIEGETITFKVNGITATSRVIDPKGFNTNIDLNVSYAPPPEAPTVIGNTPTGTGVPVTTV